MSFEIIDNSIECDRCYPKVPVAIKDDNEDIRCSNCLAKATEGHGSIWVKKRSARYALVFMVLIFILFRYFHIASFFPSPDSGVGKFYFIAMMYFGIPAALGWALGWVLATKQARESDVLSCKK